MTASVLSPLTPGHHGAAPRLRLIDALRAVASLTIVFHHFALYPPLAEQARSLLGPVLDALATYARSTQVFFVVGGYVMARALAARRWRVGDVGIFMAQRWCRLGLPYLAAVALALVAVTWGRGWLPDSLLGAPPDGRQLLAHVFFVQDILGFEHLSAGLWFVCINMQLGLVYVALLWLRDVGWRCIVRRSTSLVDLAMVAGWVLSAASLFYFNRHAQFDPWALYFFPYFFMGVIVERTASRRYPEREFWLFVAMFAIAAGSDWNWRLATAVAVGVAMFAADKTGFSTRWPRGRVIAQLGRVSYSLFLVHFPVLVGVAGLWARLGWTSPMAAVAGLATATLTSIGLAFVFHRAVERPAARWARRLASNASMARATRARPLPLATPSKSFRS